MRERSLFHELSCCSEVAVAPFLDVSYRVRFGLLFPPSLVQGDVYAHVLNTSQDERIYPVYDPSVVFLGPPFFFGGGKAIYVYSVHVYFNALYSPNALL